MAQQQFIKGFMFSFGAVLAAILVYKFHCYITGHGPKTP